jgi:LuxR family maltose regulon positive regulatory protein
MHGAALFNAGEPVAGLASLANALRTASSEGFIRLILDEGDIMRAPIHALTATLQSGALQRDEAVFVSYVQRLAQALGPITPASVPSDKVQSAILLEPLTRKEMHVLQLLAEGYSNSAMAEKLFVSDSTIRTHLRNINTKLDAQNRTHAVATARRLNIIP